MKGIVGVKFSSSNKIQFIDTKYLNVEKDQKVIAEIDNGEDIGTVVAVPKQKIIAIKREGLTEISRLANQKDLKQEQKCKKLEKEALTIAKKKIKEHKLEMYLKSVEYRFDNTRITFYFTAEGRIDFRDLVKDLAIIYKTRIELRQMNIRDEVKRCGGLGMCGRQLCCASYLDNNDSVTMKMAKDQGLSLNPTKISGNCGKLMCCLKYEQEVYQEKNARMPEIGEVVNTPDGEGEIDRLEVLKEIVRVKFKDGEGFLYKKYKISDIKKKKNN